METNLNIFFNLRFAEKQPHPLCFDGAQHDGPRFYLPQFSPVSRQASGESGQNNGGLCGGQGHWQTLPKPGHGANEVAARFSSPWFCLFCRVKALCGKDASLLTAFLVTFVATKVTGPPAAKSGSATCLFALYSLEIASFLAMTREECLLNLNYTLPVPIFVLLKNCISIILYLYSNI